MISLIERDGHLWFLPRFLEEEEAAQLHEGLLTELSWSSESIRIFAKPVQSPRLVSWYGDPEAIYSYSGIVHHPLPWHPLLHSTKIRVEEYTNASFNSVLCNLYRNGNDSMGWHADKEKELGPNPRIASLSLGETRIFRIRHRQTGETHDFELENGSLIFMTGPLQNHWRHCVPKTGKAVKSRINLSFRQILHAAKSFQKKEDPENSKP